MLNSPLLANFESLRHLDGLRRLAAQPFLKLALALTRFRASLSQPAHNETTI